MVNFDFATGLLTVFVGGYAIISLLLRDVIPQLHEKLSDEMAEKVEQGIYFNITFGVILLAVGGFVLLSGIVRQLPIENPDFLSVLGVRPAWVIYGGTGFLGMGLLVLSYALARSTSRLYRASGNREKSPTDASDLEGVKDS